MRLTLTVPDEDDGLLVRRLALERLRMSYGQFKRAKFEGVITLDGEPAHANVHARAGQRLCIELPQKAGELPQHPSTIALTVLFEDDDLLVVDKPAPLPSISSAHQDGETLEGAVYAYFGCPDGFLYRPVNRLDKGTSGIMVVAKHSHAQQFLQAELHSDAFVREYLAVCEGAPPQSEDVIDLPIAKEDAASIRRVISENGRPARTQYRVLERKNGRCLLRLRLETGRTHQIRVHLSAIGCPVAGDFLYGVELPELPRRFALHSCSLRLQTLHSGEIAIESPLPTELRRLLDGA